MSNILQLDDRLLAVLTKATRDGLAMGGMNPIPVSISCRFLCTREVTAIIGCVGHLSGSICVNCTPAGAIYMTDKMLGENHTEMDAAVASKNKTERPYKDPLSISKGAAAFHPGEDTEYQDVFRRADQTMYQEKAAYYKAHNRRKHRD